MMYYSFDHLIIIQLTTWLCFLNAITKKYPTVILIRKWQTAEPHADNHYYCHSENLTREPDFSRVTGASASLGFSTPRAFHAAFKNKACRDPGGIKVLPASAAALMSWDYYYDYY
ncbi:hypothetical protein BDBG_16232 [Blastomyces gilchristii SLH14081]|uniref:Uncharacterized protein n=1 Tax=Blastomyces gilchristii (strain SLH14081) TaxID=559298 RepID=A0A179U923_BLAGS|nr:uncharacterized protein BDBG_16232 [Blastomyces gilchristii SLH14081]OAT04340.1 hypothetical protein BDBG_16232 [Blastomyces gilchristii SLH14081]